MNMAEEGKAIMANKLLSAGTEKISNNGVIIGSEEVVNNANESKQTEQKSETKRADNSSATFCSSITIDYIVKILIVGNAKCGKSSIIGQYMSKSFNGKYQSTIGAEFARKDILLELPNTKTLGVRLQLWDIAGQDRFQKLTRAYFTHAKGVVIVCDVSRPGTGT
jgi:GTPase SAR1 family protein